MQIELLKWLKDIGETKAANFFAECRMDIVYVDTLFEMSGGERTTELVDCEIGVPGEYFLKLQTDYFAQVHTIETQIAEVATAIGFLVRDIKWMPKIEIENDNNMKISIVARQGIFDEITLNKISWSGRLEEPDFLNRIFDLSKLPSTDSRYDNAFDDIHKHRILNYDWEDDWVFTDRRFNLLHCDEETFLKFLTLSINPVSRNDDEGINQLLEIYNRYLASSGIEFYEKSNIATKPIYGHKLIDATSSVSGATAVKFRKLALVVGCSEYEFAGTLAENIFGILINLSAKI